MRETGHPASGRLHGRLGVGPCVRRFVFSFRSPRPPNPTPCQDHQLGLARSHVERVVASAFRAGSADAPPTLRPILTDLADLHVLNGLGRDAAWFQSAGVMEGNKAKAIRGLVLRLSASIAAAAEGLVDAFGIPDAVLGAPIATSGEHSQVIRG